jgi:hypothetical protein
VTAPSAGLPQGPSVPDWDPPASFLERLEDLEVDAVLKSAAGNVLTGSFVPGTGPNVGQITLAPASSANPGGVAMIHLVANNGVANLQKWDGLIGWSEPGAEVESATLKCHVHVDGGGTITDRHIQFHTKNAAGTDLTSRLEIQYGTDDAYILVTSAHLYFDNGAYIKTDTDGLPIKDSGGTQRFEFEDSGVFAINTAGQVSSTATAGTVHTVPATARKYWVVRDDTGTLRKIALYDA